MENDLEFGFIPNKEITNSNIFKLEFVGQSYENNKNFKEWKLSLIRKYGKKIKIFKCHEDKILFCKHDLLEEDKHQCPICKNYICYYCSKRLNYKNCNSCCLYSKLKILKLKEEGDLKNVFNSFIFQVHLIPILNIIFLIIIISHQLFFNLYTNYPEQKKSKGKYIKYGTYIKSRNKKLFYILFFIHICMPIILVIGYIIYIIIYTMFFILICLFTKYRPLKILIIFQISSLFD